MKLMRFTVQYLYSCTRCDRDRRARCNALVLQLKQQRGSRNQRTHMRNPMHHFYAQPPFHTVYGAKQRGNTAVQAVQL